MKAVGPQKSRWNTIMGEQALYANGFKSIDRELSLDQLPVSGRIPAWLRGDLFRSSPARFDLKKQRLHHWFDGLALLDKFSIGPQGVSYRSRFLQSDTYLRSRATGRLPHRGFGTAPTRSLVQRIGALFNPPALDDNAISNIVRMNGQLVALAESNRSSRFKPDTLETTGHFPFEDDLVGSLTAAHPHYDDWGGMISFLLDIDAESSYILYRQAPNSRMRKIISRIEVEEPAYMHSFALTRNYIILVEFPLFINPVSFRFLGKPFLQHCKWEPDRSTRFLVVDRRTGALSYTFHIEACFAFHQVNAYEEGDRIMVDMAVYPDAAVLEELYLNRLRAPNHTIATAHLLRVELDLANGRADEYPLAEAGLEFPAIHPDCDTRHYRSCYGVSSIVPGDFIDALVKIDVNDGSYRTWHQAGRYPGQPVFVPRPRGDREDEGVLLSVVYDGRNDRSFLLLLDATFMEEVARVELPERVPYGFHGQFFGR